MVADKLVSVLKIEDDPRYVWSDPAPCPKHPLHRVFPGYLRDTEWLQNVYPGDGEFIAGRMGYRSGVRMAA